MSEWFPSYYDGYETRWSDEDQCYLARCAPEYGLLAFLETHGDTREQAIKKLVETLPDVACMNHSTHDAWVRRARKAEAEIERLRSVDRETEHEPWCHARELDLCTGCGVKKGWETSPTCSDGAPHVWPRRACICGPNDRRKAERRAAATQEPEALSERDDYRCCPKDGDAYVLCVSRGDEHFIEWGQGEHAPANEANASVPEDEDEREAVAALDAIEDALSLASTALVHDPLEVLDRAWAALAFLREATTDHEEP